MTDQSILPRSALIVLSSFLAACGGGATAPGLIGTIAISAEATPLEQTLSAIESDPSSEAALALVFDGIQFNSTDGFVNGFAEQSGGTGFLDELDIANPTNTTLFAGFSDTAGALQVLYFGILGSEPSNIPTTSTARWTGVGFANHINGPELDLGSGPATVSADFDDNSVTAEITGLSGVIDTISLTDMVINGARFSGTSVATFKNGAAVNIVGASPVGQSEGSFFGPAAVEVGGLFTLEGSDDTLIGGFAANSAAP